MKQSDNSENRKGTLKSDVLVGKSRKWACLKHEEEESNGIIMGRGQCY